MAIESVKGDALAHVQEGQLHESALQQFCNSISIGPVTVKYCLDISVPRLTFEVYLVGVRIGGGTIDPQHPSVTIGGSVAGFKAEVTLTADFNKKQVTYKITLCAPIVGCKNFSGVLFSW